jgi:PPOX class probable F420-dependent enzyme
LYFFCEEEEQSMSDVATPKDAHEVERLRGEIIGWLATTRPDGHPNLAPVWFLWEDPTILIFSQPNKQKLHNIGQNPHVMLGLETEDRGDDAVMIEGTATLIDDPTITTTLPAYAAKYGPNLEKLGWTAEGMAKAFTVAIRITPTKFRRLRAS